MHTIRNYKNSDYEELKKWWNDQGEPAPFEDLIPVDSTFVLELNGVPALSISVYKTNVKGMAFLENFIGNPVLKKERSKYSSVLVEHAVEFLKESGYKRVVCFSYKEKLKNKYQELGMKKTLDNLTSFVREIK